MVLKVLQQTFGCGARPRPPPAASPPRHADHPASATTTPPHLVIIQTALVLLARWVREKLFLGGTLETVCHRREFGGHLRISFDVGVQWEEHS